MESRRRKAKKKKLGMEVFFPFLPSLKTRQRERRRETKRTQGEMSSAAAKVRSGEEEVDELIVTLKVLVNRELMETVNDRSKMKII